jgi:hypothetical protein
MPTATYRIAGAQLGFTDTVAGNVAKIVSAIERAGAEGADFLVVPEMMLTGYHKKWSQEEAEEGYKAVSVACREARVCGLIGAGEWRDGDGRGSSHVQARPRRISDDRGLLQQLCELVWGQTEGIHMSMRPYLVVKGGQSIQEVLSLEPFGDDHNVDVTPLVRLPGDARAVDDECLGAEPLPYAIQALVYEPLHLGIEGALAVYCMAGCALTHSRTPSASRMRSSASGSLTSLKGAPLTEFG